MRRLLIRPGAIGDSILGIPALEHLCEGYTEVWVRSEIVPLISFAGRVRAISSTGLDLVEIDPPERTLAELASFCKIDSWYGAGRPEFRAAVEHLPFRFHAALPPSGSAVHAADFFAAQVGAPLPAIPRLRVEPVDHGAAVVHPFSGSPGKNWPLARFEELAVELHAEWAARPDWVRFENLSDLARWLAGARVFIGNDSGITHLAAAAGCPVVALFGPTDPAVWAPRGERVRILRASSMDDISLDQVLDAVQALV